MSQEASPRLSLELISPIETDETKLGRVRGVSKHVPVKLEVVLTRPPWDLTIPSLSGEGVLSFVSFKRTADGALSPAPYLIHAKRVLTEATAERAFISMFLPLNEASRKERVATEMEDALREGQAEGIVGEHFAEGVRQYHEQFVAFMDEALLENDVGAFEVTAVYRVQQEGGWSGELRSRTLRFFIIAEGPSA